MGYVSRCVSDEYGWGPTLNHRNTCFRAINPKNTFNSQDSCNPTTKPGAGTITESSLPGVTW